MEKHLDIKPPVKENLLPRYISIFLILVLIGFQVYNLYHGYSYKNKSNDYKAEIEYHIEQMEINRDSLRSNGDVYYYDEYMFHFNSAIYIQCKYTGQDYKKFIHNEQD